MNERRPPPTNAPLDPSCLTADRPQQHARPGRVSIVILALTDDAVHATTHGDPLVIRRRIGRLVHLLAENPSLLRVIAGLST